MEYRNSGLKYFLSFGFRYKPRVILYFISKILHASITVIPLYLMKNFLEILFSDNIENFIFKLVTLAIIVGICGVFIGIFSYFYQYLGHYLSARIGIDIKNTIYNHFTEMPLSYFQKQEKGDLITKMTHDTEMTTRAIQRVLVHFMPRSFEMAAQIVVLFLLSWQLSLILVLILPLVALLVRSFGKKISRRSRRTKEKLSESTVTMEQFFQGIKLVKSFHSHEREEEKFRNVNQAFLKAHLSTSRVQSRSIAILELLATWLLVGVFVTGITLILNKYFGLTSAVLLTFIGVFAALLNKSRRIAQHSVGIAREFPSIQRLHDILKTESDITIAIGAVTIDTVEPGIEFKDVRFSYENEEVIKGVSLHIKPGEMVAFVGPSGGGKTTLLDLVPRFYEVDSGELLIGGKNIKDIKPESLMEKIAIVLQDSFIFNSSAFENIRYGLPDASLNKVQVAAKDANIHDEIEKLPEGYNTFLGEEGTILSGGQKQRLSIARALLKGSPILLMDEPTSELDSESEKLIIDTLEQIRKDKILLVIAHRLSTVLHSDNIVVINDGEIEAQGTHDELLKTSPTYKRMYDIQFKDSIDGADQRTG
jgi:subfamily B ATP-binding cassette protein MsbA